MFHTLFILRTYLQMNQTQLANASEVYQGDISEIENHPPYGHMDKFQRLSKFLGVPVEALVKDDPRLVPMSFFEKHPTPTYKPVPEDPEQLLGRQGEEFILLQERERLERINPALSRLVIPFFKLKGIHPGFDILSFDDSGTPIPIEVKTSISTGRSFRLTTNEYNAAKKFRDAGEEYVICHITGWGSKTPHVRRLPLEELEQHYQFSPMRFNCWPKPAKTRINGIAYWRQMRGLRQEDVASEFGIPPCDISLYETGNRNPSVGFYVQLSNMLDVTVDDLLAEYDLAERSCFDGF